jgi:hypothetical protein
VNLAALEFKNEIRLGDIIAAASFSIAALGLFLNWWQLRLGGIRKRAEFVVSVFNRYVMDPVSSKAFYDIEYDRFRYDDDFHESEAEQHLDRLLTYFEKVAALYDMGTITLKDLELVRYEFVRVHRNQEVQKYFAFLDKSSRGLNIRGGTYERYRRLAALLERNTPGAGRV